MPLTPEQRDAVVSELKRIGSLMNLSDDQKRKLHDFMPEASEKVQSTSNGTQMHRNKTRSDKELLTTAQSFVNVSRVS